MDTNIRSFIERNKMPIIVSLPENSIEMAKAALDAGADALKVHINVSHRASGNEFFNTDYYKKVFKEIRDLYEGPLGIVLGDDKNKIDSVDLEELKSIGFTYFSVYEKDITTKLILQTELEKTVALNDKFDIENVRLSEQFGINVLELSIVDPNKYGERLCLEDLMKYAAFRKGTGLPLMIPSQKKMIPEDLEVLHQIGIDSVMLGAMTIGTTVESVHNTVSKFIAKRNTLS